MASAYRNVLRDEPAFTSWKFRIDEDNSLFRNKKKVVTEWKYTIDFIFHSDYLKTLAILDLPEEKDIDNAYGDGRKASENDVEFAKRRCLLPNKRCPSDHVPIIAQ